MTQPGITYPAQPGWWVRTAKIGVTTGAYAWSAATPRGVRTPLGHASGTYGWAGANTLGVKMASYISGGGVQQSTTSPLSWTEAVPAGTRLVIIWVEDDCGSEGGVGASVGGTAMTLTQDLRYYNSGSNLWYLRCFTLLLAPGSTIPGTSPTFSVTNSGTVETRAATAYYRNVASVGTPQTTTGAANFSLSQTVASSDPTVRYAQAFSYADISADNASAYNQTQRSPSGLLTGVNGSIGPMVFGDAPGNGGTLTFSATRSDNTYPSGGIAVPLFPFVAAQIISSAGIPTGGGFGTPTIALGLLNVSPTGIASTEAFGAPTVTPGAVNLSPSGMGTAEAFGAPTVTPGTVNVSPADISSLEAFGADTVTTGPVNVSPTGIASAEAFGTATVKNILQFVSPTGIASAETFGSTTVTLDSDQLIIPSGLASGETFGAATVTTGPVSVSPTGIGSAETFGATTVTPGAVNLAPTGIASAEAFGSDTVTSVASIAPTGIASAGAFGAATVTPGAVTISPSGIASAEAFGTATVATVAAMTLKGANSGSGTSVTIPTHAIGDTIYIFAYRDGSNTVPSKPTPSGTVPSWNDEQATNGANSNSCRLASFVATATNHTSGTWTSATGMIAAVVSGAYGSGNQAQQGGSTTTSAVAPVVAQTVRTGTPLYLSFFGHRTLSAWGTAPTGYTLQTSTTAGDVALLSDNDPSSVSSVTMPCTATGAGYRGIQLEILPTIAAPTPGSTEMNVARTSVAVPSGLSTGIYVTMIGAGGAGGTGGDGFSTGGAGGAGGAARINRTLVPVASLGTTFTVVQGTPGISAGAGGNASTFTTGSVSLSAGGGSGGVSAAASSGAAASAGGAGGTYSISGVTGTGVNGTAGGRAGWSSAGGAGGSDATNNVGCGGGGGGDNGYNGGAGGSSMTVTGGSGGPNGSAGSSPVDASAGGGGAGGGGGGSGGVGANAGAFGGGGGGGGVPTEAPGSGGIGYTYLEFV